jgi:spore cortex formation protein SpoVR/YcgB (stage V sporulation)
VCYGISMSTNNIWVLVSTYVINAIIASSLMIAYTHWWLKHRFGKVKTYLEVDGKTQVNWVLTNKPKPSFIQKALDQE